MRLPVSLLILCAAISGCTSSSVSTQTDTVIITSNPTSAAVRLNGKAVGRTPTKITVDRVNNYELQVGKGGYTPESTIIKPTLRNGKVGMEFGFPES
ncbi:MAG: PEGA domain-containing protein, partial [Verrucomicrobiota bacterium]